MTPVVLAEARPIRGRPLPALSRFASACVSEQPGLGDPDVRFPVHSLVTWPDTASFHRDGCTTRVRHRCTQCKQEWNEWRTYVPGDANWMLSRDLSG